MCEQPHPASPVADQIPRPRVCAACNGVHMAALVAYPNDDMPPVALCAACARDQHHLRLLIRAFEPGTITIVSRSDG